MDSRGHLLERSEQTTTFWGISTIVMGVRNVQSSDVDGFYSLYCLVPPYSSIITYKVIEGVPDLQIPRGTPLLDPRVP